MLDPGENVVINALDVSIKNLDKSKFKIQEIKSDWIPKYKIKKIK
jgi:hypothetical protein